MHAKIHLPTHLLEKHLESWLARLMSSKHMPQTVWSERNPSRPRKSSRSRTHWADSHLPMWLRWRCEEQKFKEQKRWTSSAEEICRLPCEAVLNGLSAFPHISRPREGRQRKKSWAISHPCRCISRYFWPS